MMSDTVRSLSTSGLTLKQQIQCWSGALTDLCGQFDIDPLEASSFEGRMKYTEIGKLKLCQIEVSRHRLIHTASRLAPDGYPFVQIHFQTYGVSHFEQSGHRIELIPGDCLAYNASCPHVIVSPMQTRHEVVIMPNELLRKRGFRSAKMSACKFSARFGTGRIAHSFVHAAFDEANKLSPNEAIGVADSLIDLLLLSLRGPDAM
jgi:AraC family transcriptional regulator, positive regulator of tynA and feaB